MRKKYVLIHDAQKHNFEQLAAQLLAHEERTLMGVFKSVYRLKRGVMDTALIAPEIVSYQDMIYAQGYERITNWLSAGNDIVLLKKGKIKIEDLCYLG